MALKQQNNKKKAKLFVVMVVVIVTAIVIAGVLLLCNIKEMKITGNEYLSDQSIADWIREDKYASNSLYVWNKYNSAKAELHPNLEQVKVILKNPWTVEVKVTEKKLAGYLLDEGDFVYFSQTGEVLLRDGELRDGVPVVEGMVVESAKLSKKLKVQEQKVLDTVLEITNILSECELVPDKIGCDQTEIYLYFQNVCVCTGDYNLEARLIQLPPILAELGDQKGTLYLGNYQETGDMISFERGIWPGEEAELAEAVAESDEETDEEVDEQMEDQEGQENEEWNSESDQNDVSEADEEP